MKSKVLLLVTFTLFVCASGYAQSKKELEKKLDERYKKGQKVNVVPGKIIVAPYEVEGIRPTDSDFSVHYDHFYKGIEMSKRYQKRDELDERTTSEVDATAKFISEMKAGEALELLRVDLFKRGRDVYMLDFMLKAIAVNRLATATDARYPDQPTKLPFGVHFRFVFPLDVVEKGDFDAIVREVNPYIVPAAEYKEAQAKTAQAEAAQKNIDIQPGMSREGVVKAMGDPAKSITFGKRTTLTYREVTITLEDNKVVDVKPN